MWTTFLPIAVLIKCDMMRARHYETHLSTEAPEKGARPWIPEASANTYGPTSTRPPAGEGAAPSYGVIKGYGAPASDAFFR